MRGNLFFEQKEKSQPDQKKKKNKLEPKDI